MNINSKEFLEFLVKAKKGTYANSDAPKVLPSRLNSKDYEFTDGDFTYHDAYFGGVKFMGEVLYKELNKVFEEILNKGVFPVKKEPTKTSLLDDFLVSGSMSRFDRLFQALGRYQTYKEYSNSVISEKDKLLNEIYDKFVMP